MVLPERSEPPLMLHKKGLLPLLLPSTKDLKTKEGSEVLLPRSFFVPLSRKRTELAGISLLQEGRMGVSGRSCSFQDYDRRPSAGLPYGAASFNAASNSHSSSDFSATIHTGIHSSASHEKGDKEDHFSKTSVLFSSLHRSQERWTKPANYRPVMPEHPPDGPQVQDGKDFGHRFLHPCSNVGMYGGLPGCLLSCPHGLAQPQVSGVHSRRSDICLPVPPLWALHCPMGFFQDYEAYQSPPAYSYPPFPLLSGRFPSPGPFQGGTGITNGLCSLTSWASWHQDQCQEVKSIPVSNGGIPRGYISPGLTPSVTSGFQDHQDQVSVSGHLQCIPSHSTPTGKLGGNSQLCLLLHPSGTSSPQTRHFLDEQQHHCRSKGQAGFSFQGSVVLAGNLDRRLVPECSNSYESSYSHFAADDRRFSFGMGRHSHPSLGFRGLAKSLLGQFHKLAGTQCSFSFGPVLPAPYSRSLRSAPYRQHHSNLLYSEPRLPQIYGSHVLDDISPGVLQSSLCDPFSKTSEWFPQCPGRPKVSSPSSVNRVVSGHGDLRVDLLPSWGSSGGSVCHSGKSSPSSLCVSLSRPGCSGRERSVVPMGPLGVNLPIPSCSAPSQSCDSSASIPRSRCAYSPLLCTVKLAAQPPSTVSQSASSSTSSFVVAGDQDRSGFSPQPFCFSSSRVDTVSRGLLASGFDPVSIRIFLLSHAESSTRQYQSVWSKFLSFLSLRRIPHRDTSVAVVCNFLAREATVNSLKYRTLSGYRCALHLPILWACNIDINTPASDRFLRGLFNHVPPVRAKPMPIWNINVLLDFLQSSRFEPLQSTLSLC